MKIFCAEHGGAVEVDATDMGQDVGCPTCGAIVSVPVEALAPGVVLDDFVVDGVISRGTTIITLRAHQLTMDRPVALRVLRPEVAEDEAAVSRFLQEARGGGALTHPNLLRTFAINQAEGYYFAAIELLQGRRLDHWLQEHGRPEADWVLARAAELVAGLAEAWDVLEQAHGDLHVRTIMIRESDASACILRFGMDHPTAAELNSEEEAAELAYYAAPELAEGQEPNRQSDMYSLGAILYRMLTGLAPAEGATAAEVTRAHLSGLVQRPHELQDAVPEAVDALVMRLLARDPAARPADYGELRELLGATREAMQAAARAAAPPPPESPPVSGKDTRSRGMRRTRGGMHDLARAAVETQTLRTVTAPEPRGGKPPIGLLLVLLGSMLTLLTVVAIFAIRHKQAYAPPTVPADRRPPTAPADPVRAVLPADFSAYRPLPGPLADLADDAPLRVMAMGDWLACGSVTNVSYASSLQDAFAESGRELVWVGHLETDGRHVEAGIGYSTQQILDGRFWADQQALTLKRRLAEHKPGVVLLHTGTHDLDERLGDADWRQAPERTLELIRAIHAQNPTLYVLVATLVSPSRPETQLLVDDYNTRLTALVSQEMLGGRPVGIIPMHRAAVQDYRQTIGQAFPTADDYSRIGVTWYKAISRWSAIRPIAPESWPQVGIAEVTDLQGRAQPGLADGVGIDASGRLAAASAATTGSGWDGEAPLPERPLLGAYYTWPRNTASGLQLRLERATTVRRFCIWTAAPGRPGVPAGQPREVAIQTSNDGRIWDERGVQLLLPAPATQHYPAQCLDVRWPATVYLRIHVLSTWDTWVKGDYDPARPGTAPVRLQEIRVAGEAAY